MCKLLPCPVSLMRNQARMEEAAMLAPTLRKSTRERIEEAERERQLVQQVPRLWILLYD